MEEIKNYVLASCRDVTPDLLELLKGKDGKIIGMADHISEERDNIKDILKLRNSCGEPENIDLVEKSGKLVMVHEDGTEEDFNNTMGCVE